MKPVREEQVMTEHSVLLDLESLSASQIATVQRDLLQFVDPWIAQFRTMGTALSEDLSPKGLLAWYRYG